MFRGIKAGTGFAILLDMIADTTATRPDVVYWHRHLPPANADIVGEYVVEATSQHVPGTIARRAEIWDECYEGLMNETNRRIEQEVMRLEGRYAHVLDESIQSQHNVITNESWLRGRFRYTLLR